MIGKKRGKKLGAGNAAPTAATCPLRQTVTPTLHATQAVIWYHSTVGKNKIYQLVVGGTSTGSDLAYKQPGTLTSDNANARLFTDSSCKKPAGNAIVLPWKTLLAGKTYYYQGAADGATVFTLTLGATADDRITVVAPVSETVTVNEANLVTPKIELEYKVALLKRNLTAPATEPTMTPTPTMIQISFTESRPEVDRAFTKGAKLTGGSANIDVFADALCATPVIDLNTPFTSVDLRAIKSIYVRGKVAKKFTLKLELQPGDDADKVRLKPPAEEEFGVVELQFEVHYFKDSSSRPAADPRTKHNQIAMPDTDRVTAGRLLHLQNGFNDHTRAKIVFKKLVKAQWPAGCDAYDIVFNREQRQGAGAGELAIFDVERAGVAKAFPLVVSKQNALTSDKKFWIEGTVGSDVIRSLTVDLGIDRADGGLPKTAKRYGDWARATVISVTEVKPSELQLPGGPVVLVDNGGSYEAYINLRNDGRRLKIQAQIAPALPDIKLYFHWFPDKDNTKAANHEIDFPAAWDRKKMKVLSAVDTANPGDKVHLSAKTDATGKAEVELKLSQYGGDKLKVGAYIDQDPIHGQWLRDDPFYGLQKPTRSNDMIVWRKFWYQIVSPTGFNDHDADVVAKRPAFERVKSRFAAAPAHNVVPVGNAIDTWPRYNVEVNGGHASALVINANNSAHYLSGIAADAAMPIKVPVLVCDAQCDPKGLTKSLNLGPLAPAGFPLDIIVSKETLDPPLQGGTLLAGGMLKAVNAAGVVLYNAAIAPGDVSIQPARTSLKQVRLSLPAAAAAWPPAAVISISGFTVQGAASYLGEYSPTEKRVIAVYQPTEPVDFGDTIVHELGHAFYQTPDSHRDPSVTPKHKYAKNESNQGTHCRNKNGGAGFVCVMYDSGPNPTGLNRYCDYCHPYLLVQKMESLS